MIKTSQTGVLPLGSDFPVKGINPLLVFYAAVTRHSVSGQSPHGAQGWVICMPRGTLTFICFVRCPVEVSCGYFCSINSLDV